MRQALMGSSLSPKAYLESIGNETEQRKGDNGDTEEDYGEYRQAFTSIWDMDNHSYGSYTSGEEDDSSQGSDADYGAWHGDEDGSQDFQ